MFHDAMRNLKQDYAQRPEKFPEVPGQKYYIVQLDSEGDMVKSPGRGQRVSVPNGTLEIRALPEGSEKIFICWEL